jgi:peptidylprolyl isomerase
MRIEYGGKNAIIRSIGAGRALLDFNPPLAGKTLVYAVTVEKKLDSMEDKVGALIHRRIPITEEGKFKFDCKDNVLTVDMPEETLYIEGVQIAKRGIAMDLQKFFPDLVEIKFVDSFKAPPKPAETKPAAEEATPAPAEAQPAVEAQPPAPADAKPDETSVEPAAETKS